MCRLVPLTTGKFASFAFEEQLVLQSRVRINAGLTLHPAGLLLAYTLVLKKKQFERLRYRCSQ